MSGVQYSLIGIIYEAISVDKVKHSVKEVNIKNHDLLAAFTNKF